MLVHLRRCPSSSSARSPWLQRQRAAPTISPLWSIFPACAPWSLHPLLSRTDQTRHRPDYAHVGHLGCRNRGQQLQFSPSEVSICPAFVRPGAVELILLSNSSADQTRDGPNIKLTGISAGSSSTEKIDDNSKNFPPRKFSSLGPQA